MIKDFLACTILSGNLSFGFIAFCSLNEEEVFSGNKKQPTSSKK
jgi:hypothetical protein